jgi:hypothetical protein
MEMEWQDDVAEDELRQAVRKYLPDTVLWTTDWTTGALVDQIRRSIFNVDPPFQRRNAWDDKKASLYIESLLLGCPVPAITLAEARALESPVQYVVIDGKQRLSALKRFAVDQTLKLTGLETLPDLNGRQYKEIQHVPEFARFENLPIRTIVMRNWRQDDVLQFVFHRLNSQVTPLSTHELRRALHAGPFTTYLDERSATSAEIKRILNIHEPDYRLRDAELLLRAISFCCFSSRYKGNLKHFLDTSTKTLNANWTTSVRRSLDDISNDIDSAISVTYDIFGDQAFQRYEEGLPLGRFNRAVFDIMILTLRYDMVRKAALNKPEAVAEALPRLMAEDFEFSRWTTATTKSRDAVEGRVKRWANSLGAAIGIGNLPELAIESAMPTL